MPNFARGLFITFEGGEGAGKSTQSRLITEKLTSLGLDVVATREPGGTDTAELLRGFLLNPDIQLDAMEQVLLFYAARHNHVEQLIRPALAAGKIVVCDRFSDSTRAYQGAAGGVGLTDVSSIEATVLNGFRPDLTLLLDLPVARGAERVRSRGNETDRFEQAPSSFHQRLRDAFLEIAHAEPDRVKIIDAGQGADEVAALVLHEVESLLSGVVEP